MSSNGSSDNVSEAKPQALALPRSGARLDRIEAMSL